MLFMFPFSVFRPTLNRPEAPAPPPPYKQLVAVHDVTDFYAAGDATMFTLTSFRFALLRSFLLRALELQGVLVSVVL